MIHQSIITATRQWISDIVIGLNLCPFANRVFQAELIRYVVFDANENRPLLDALSQELITLHQIPIEQVETTLFIVPNVPGSFLDFMEFVGAGEDLIADLGLRGETQLASFHPAYQFAGTPIDSVENYTNRSPYPMLHLLREDSISAVAGDADEIPRINLETLHRLGLEQVIALHNRILR